MRAALIIVAAAGALAACGDPSYSDANFLDLCESRAPATRVSCSCTVEKLRARGGFDDPRDLRDALTERRADGPLEYAPDPAFRSALFDCSVQEFAARERAKIRERELAKVDDSIRRWFTAVREGDAPAICAHETEEFSRDYRGGAHRELCADEQIGVDLDLILAEVPPDRTKPAGQSLQVELVEVSPDGKTVSAKVRAGADEYAVKLRAAPPRGWKISALTTGR